MTKSILCCNNHFSLGRCEDSMGKIVCRRLAKQCRAPKFIERMKDYCYDSCGYCSKLPMQRLFLEYQQARSLISVTCSNIMPIFLT